MFVTVLWRFLRYLCIERGSLPCDATKIYKEYSTSSDHTISYHIIPYRTISYHIIPYTPYHHIILLGVQVARPVQPRPRCGDGPRGALPTSQPNDMRLGHRHIVTIASCRASSSATMPKRGPCTEPPRCKFTYMAFQMTPDALNALTKRLKVR